MHKPLSFVADFGYMCVCWLLLVEFECDFCHFRRWKYMARFEFDQFYAIQRVNETRSENKRKALIRCVFWPFTRAIAAG